MATAEAEELTRRHREQVLRLAGLIGQRIGAQARRADADDIDGWWERIGPRVQREILTGQGALAQLARRYLRAHAAAEGVELDPVRVEPSAERVATSMHVTGPVAFKRHVEATGDERSALRAMATQMEGSAMRLAMEGPRRTAMATLRQREVVQGYRRVGRSQACPFCLMLIGRGAVYSKRSARFRAHDHCKCTAELVYRREQEPEHVRRLQAQWREATRGKTGAAALAAWRRWQAEQQGG